MLEKILTRDAWVQEPEPVFFPSMITEGINTYAPWILHNGEMFMMWYGGQMAKFRDGHDRIHLATSLDGEKWEKQGVVVDNGYFYHINDPSVVHVDGTYHMYVTAGTATAEIHHLTSPNGVVWRNVQKITFDSHPINSSRPSIKYDHGQFKLWFDVVEKPRKHMTTRFRNVYYAESSNGNHFTTPIQVWQHAGAVNVTCVDDHYIMLFEGHDGTHAVVSENGKQFSHAESLPATTIPDLIKPDQEIKIAQGLLLPKQNRRDLFGHVTPFLYNNQGQWEIYAGWATRKTWDRNRIGKAKLKD